MFSHHFAESIIRKYDIRGIVNEDLTEKDAYAIGFGLVSQLRVKNLKTEIVVMCDARSSGALFKKSVINGIIEAGGHAIDCGMGTSPMCYFASNFLNASGFIMVTGSHNPLNYNGFKFGINHQPFSEEEILNFASIVQKGIDKRSGGAVKNFDISEKYIERIMQHFLLPQKLKFGFNALNGGASSILPLLSKKIGGMVFQCEDELKTQPDPSIQTNIIKIREDVLKHDLDIIFVFDGDADRIMAITKNNVLNGEDILFFCIREVLAKAKGKIIFDVKCSNAITDEVLKHGGVPIMYKTGHSLIKKKMIEEGAILAGENSGHIYFQNDYYGFDDGIYTAMRLLSYFSTNDFCTEITSMPKTVKSPEIKILCKNKFAVIEKLQADFKLKGIQFNDIDGIRMNVSKTAWFLIRASNTEEILVVRYEAETEVEYQKVKKYVEELLG